MKKNLLKNKTFWLAVVASGLCLSVSVPSAMAYFTTYVQAEGGYEITLGSETEIHEDVKDMTKEISLTNTGETDCYVRVKVFSGSQIDITYTSALDGNGNAYWTKNDDGYWYYSEILKVNSSSEILKAKIEMDEDFKESFNVIVVQECTPVQYHEDGTPYADWNAKVDTKTDIGVQEAAQ